MPFSITKIGLLGLGSPLSVLSQVLTTQYLTISNVPNTVVLNDLAAQFTAINSVETRIFTVTGPAIGLSQVPSALPTSVGILSAGSQGSFIPVQINGYSINVQIPSGVPVPTETLQIDPAVIASQNQAQASAAAALASPSYLTTFSYTAPLADQTASVQSILSAQSYYQIASLAANVAPVLIVAPDNANPAASFASSAASAAAATTQTSPVAITSSPTPYPTAAIAATLDAIVQSASSAAQQSLITSLSVEASSAAQVSEVSAYSQNAAALASNQAAILSNVYGTVTNAFFQPSITATPQDLSSSSSSITTTTTSTPTTTQTPRTISIDSSLLATASFSVIESVSSAIDAEISSSEIYASSVSVAAATTITTLYTTTQGIASTTRTSTATTSSTRSTLAPTNGAGSHLPRFHSFFCLVALSILGLGW